MTLRLLFSFVPRDAVLYYITDWQYSVSMRDRILTPLWKVKPSQSDYVSRFAPLAVIYSGVLHLWEHPVVCPSHFNMYYSGVTVKQENIAWWIDYWWRQSLRDSLKFLPNRGNSQKYYHHRSLPQEPLMAVNLEGLGNKQQRRSITNISDSNSRSEVVMCFLW